MTAKHPESSRDSAEESPSQFPRGRRVKRQRGEPKLYISFLPEGKGGPREDKGSVPLEVDVEDHIEERSDCESGIYRIEKKRSGEFSGEVLFYTKEEDDTRGSDAVSDDEADELSPAEFNSNSGELGASDIARLVVSTVNATLEARDKRARADQPQPGMIDMLREMEEMAERRAERDRQRRDEIRAEINAMLSREERTPPLSAEQQLRLAVVEKTGVLPMIFREMREALGTAERVAEPKGWGSYIVDFAKDLVPYVGPVVGPALGAKLITLLGKVDVNGLADASAAAKPTQGESPPVDGQQIERPLSLDDVLLYIKQDIIANNEPSECVDAVVQLLVEQPPLMPVVGELFSKENQELLALLSEATNTNLAIISNANKFVDGLREGVRSRLQVKPGATVNGNKAPAAAAAASASTGKDRLRGLARQRADANS